MKTVTSQASTSVTRRPARMQFLGRILCFPRAGRQATDGHSPGCAFYMMTLALRAVVDSSKAARS